MNGVRHRSDSDDEPDERAQEQKRTLVRTISSSQTEPAHYDIYVVPCLVPPSPAHVRVDQYYQSASFVVVNRATGLTSGLGIRFGLAPTPELPNQLYAIVDPGFSLLREVGYEPAKAVLLGWVEEERLGQFEQIVKSVAVPTAPTPRASEMLQWLLTVAAQLEYEGICANGELLLGD
ncbi:hypothetical protein OIV83_004328 [Microbotryomycetes sp. JL201]|nr:hypothetical protein OIV83_004297 [Microbotryomycetes sp. JL201]KAK4049181.1 hypothetical protein OIV83_004328 [Microbotryomycetes sp. JL201]